MKPSQVKSAINTSIKAKQPVFLWGPPGVGKSDIVASVAEENDLELIDIRAILFDPVDLRGIPHINDGLTTWAVPDFLPKEGKGLLFIDELPNAPQSVQVAFYQLVLDRKLGDYELPDGWSVLAAGNRQTDGAATYAMPAPLANRFVHVDFEVNLDDWVEWATENRLMPEIISFIRFRTDQLHDFDPKQRAFPTPRSWAFASNILQTNTNTAIEYDLLKGTVGEGAATEFVGFLRMFRELPDIDEVIKKPAAAKVPDSPAALYAIATSLAHRAEIGNFKNILTYVDRIPREFAVIAVKDSIRLNKEILKSKDFSSWAAKNSKVLL